MSGKDSEWDMWAHGCTEYDSIPPLSLSPWEPRTIGQTKGIMGVVACGSFIESEFEALLKIQMCQVRDSEVPELAPEIATKNPITVPDKDNESIEELEAKLKRKRVERVEKAWQVEEACKRRKVEQVEQVRKEKEHQKKEEEDWKCCLLSMNTGHYPPRLAVQTNTNG
ncbi:hypothetical protein BV22DRAFT_1050428 [Leucogyrophana mollusca]|uniref:Uncharacterized protein n=1 Tax=Leucogyrophana mollusca TaxID=85980 RepID=A0ACB8B3K4_9AGAM|nr:hypothetical protein BV22DRAFT_1050428 [Leucogyrophana mollusca]